MRDNSNFRRNFNVRSGSMPGGKFLGPSRSDSKPGGRVQSKKPERNKSELFKKVEHIEKDNKEIKKILAEIVKGKVICGHFVEEEVVIDVNYMNDGAARMMLVDCEAPKSVVSIGWIEGYLKYV